MSEPTPNGPKIYFARDIDALMVKLLTCEAARDMGMVHVRQNDPLAYTVLHYAARQDLREIDQLKILVCILEQRNRELQDALVKAYNSTITFTPANPL